MRRGAAVVLAVATALTLGAVGATVGSFLGWRTSHPAPTTTEAKAVLGVGLPGVPVRHIGWHDDVRDVHMMPSPGRGDLPGQQQATLTGPGVSRTEFDQARRDGMRSRTRIAAGVAVVALALSTAAVAWFTLWDLLDLAVRNGQPVALWIAYTPFLMPFGFHLG